ncbi:questin oxidase family protein [Shewanella nanhaiensis]|uniref:Questin oxidase family protein n=1 Tax=Shewanella nanhaiensis TaxID=2864872 RepID=A0ABS7E968_9GAMM|nr:questin oxidase family protein [Shewanella nanhaiensis]MBW8186239.1 questin oxidase family protein [Shewanella nanhaiensis]
MEELKLLDLLLEKSGHYHPLYGDGLATHLPMVLTALDLLNASSIKLQHTFDESIKGLEEIGSLESVISVNGIDSNLGNSESFRSYLTYFKSELEQCGTQAVLKKSLPILISGVAASAFHGLIRLAYAIEANCQSEMAIALAYWSAEYQSFELNEETTNESLESILTKLSPLGENHKFSPGLIVDRMSEIGILLKRNGSVTQPNIIDISTLREFTIKSFYLSDDFTLLHTVTGCHALSIVLPYLEDKQTALRELWKAIVVAYLSTGLRYQDKEITTVENNINFSPIIEKALKSEDSHAIKLVYTCLCEYKNWNDPLYFTVSKRAILNSHS